MIPSLSPFGDITFSDLSWPEDRRRRAIDTLEKFDFEEPIDAFSGVPPAGCWRRVDVDSNVHAMPYRLAEFCARHDVHTHHIALESWANLWVYGKDAAETKYRAETLKEYIDDSERDENGNGFELFNDYRVFDRYETFYANQNYQKWETIYLVFTVPEIMEHMRQNEISPIGWALWKYAFQEQMCFALHPQWAFEAKRDYSVTQGSGYEYLVRVVADNSTSIHIPLTHPAFMFMHQEDAFRFRTTLDMLGFYNEQSRKYEPLVPVPVFSMSYTSSGNVNPYRNNIRAANFVVI